jgi:hypothetical protein
LVRLRRVVELPSTRSQKYDRFVVTQSEPKTVATIGRISIDLSLRTHKVAARGLVAHFVYQVSICVKSHLLCQLS